MIYLPQFHYLRHNPYIHGLGKIYLYIYTTPKHSLMHKTPQISVSELVNVLKSLTLVYLKCIHRRFPDDSSCLFFLCKQYNLPIVFGHLPFLCKRPYL